jgi:hypothetical protein
MTHAEATLPPLHVAITEAVIGKALEVYLLRRGHELWSGFKLGDSGPEADYVSVHADEVHVWLVGQTLSKDMLARAVRWAQNAHGVPHYIHCVVETLGEGAFFLRPALKEHRLGVLHFNARSYQWMRDRLESGGETGDYMGCFYEGAGHVAQQQPASASLAVEIRNKLDPYQKYRPPVKTEQNQQPL